MKTVEELMIPRYIVECAGLKDGSDPYPEAIYKVGDILTFRGRLEGRPNGVDVVKKYPHIFRPIPWYERREIGDMPDYLRGIATGKVYHVEWFENHPFDLSEPNEYLRHMVRLNKSLMLPDTKQEYDSFIKKQNEK